MPQKKMVNIHAHIGMKLREKRKKAGLTLAKISEVMLVTYQQIQKYESGQSKIPINKLYAFSRLYKVPIQYFFDELESVDISEDPDLAIDSTRLFIPRKSGEPLHILLIEDNPVDEFVTRRTINEIDPNVKIFCVHNEAQVVDFLKYHTATSVFPRPDLIFMDISVSKAHTASLLFEMKRDKLVQDLPIIILTNYIAVEDLLKIYQYGASSFLRKSANPEEFKHHLSVCLEYWGEVVILPSAVLDS